MYSGRSTFFIVAVMMLVAGCQTTPSSNAGNASNPTVAAEPRESTPSAANPPAAPIATSAPALEANAKSMSTIELQKRLTELGYRLGPVDGKVGLRTTNALKKFQQDHKLTVTGTLDAETILELDKP